MKRFLLNNLEMKIAAAVIAVVLWFVVSSKGQTEMSLSASVEYTNIPHGLEIINHSEMNATLVIRGNENMLKNIRQGDVKIVLDVSRAKKGEFIYTIRKDDVRIPRNISVVMIDPASVKLVFDETAEKRVSIRPVITGSPESGYYVKSVQVKPDSALIEGAASEVRKVNHLRTEPIDITDLTENVMEQVQINLAGRHVRSRVDRVDVLIRIERRSK
jgi:YbbR domain-containing protein